MVVRAARDVTKSVGGTRELQASRPACRLDGRRAVELTRSILGAPLSMAS